MVENKPGKRRKMRKKQTGEEKDESQSDKEEDAVVKDSVDTSPVTASPGPTISRETGLSKTAAGKCQLLLK